MSEEHINVPYPKQGKAGFSYSHLNDDLGNEIGAGQIIVVVMEQWKKLVATMIIFILAGVAFALSKPNIYEAKAIAVANNGFISGESGGGAGLGALASQAGSLLSLVGGDGGAVGNSDVSRALLTLRSRVFILDMIKKNNLMPVIFPSAKPEELQTEKKYEEAYDFMSTSLTVNNEGIAYILKVRHTSPDSALILLNTAIKTLNDNEKERVVKTAKHEIDYLNGQLSQVNVIFIRETLYSIIMGKTKASTLAEAQEEYIFNVIDPPILPKKKVAPFRSLIVLIFSAIGVLVGLVVASFPVMKAVVLKEVKYGADVFQKK